jgi:hypothetical protein
MNLKEKIQTILIDDSGNLQKICFIEDLADKFTIEFAEWLKKGKFSQFGSSWTNPKLPKNSKGDWLFFTSKELLEIFKKEKGL